MEMAGTSPLQELLVPAHGDAKCVYHLIPILLCCGNDLVVLPVELLYSPLKD